MLRFIEIDGQIIEGERCFTYYDTIKDEFFGWPNSYIWDTWEDFVKDYEIHKSQINQETFPLQRFREITPDWEEWNKEKD